MSEEGDAEISLGEILATLLEYKWLIIAVTFSTLLLGAAYLYVATPIYKADALLQWDDKMVGGGGLAALKDISPLLGDNSATAAQIEILNSRMILGRVADKLKLDIQAAPKYFPIIGKAKARRYGGAELAEPVLGLSNSAPP